MIKSEKPKIVLTLNMLLNKQCAKRKIKLSLETNQIEIQLTKTYGMQ